MQGLLLAGVLTAIGVAAFKGWPDRTDWLIRAQAPGFAFVKKPMGMTAIVWISVCAGVGEELLFRAGLQTLLADHLGTVAAIAISSALFAVLHLAKPLVGLLLFAIGVALGVVYAATGSLLAVAIGHAIYDIFALSYVQKRLHELRYFEGEPTT